MTDDPFKKEREELQAFHRKQNEETAAALEEKRARIAKVRAAWVEEHGSERLRKALRLGLLGQSLGVYKTERLALECPGYVWMDPAWSCSPILNPKEEALDLLEMERERFEDARIVSLRRDGKWEPAVIVDWPFPDDDDIPGTAVLFVDKGDVARRKLARGEGLR